MKMGHGGTVLLDELGDFPPSMQAKLLRFLQEGEVQRLGSSDTVHVDARVIAATNANLPRLVKERRFRDDLYYRLAVFPIEIDPLRLRREDIAPLSQYFLGLFSREAGQIAKTFSPQAARALEQYSWPGNVRELRQVIERAFILAEEGKEIQTQHFPWATSEP
jgi:transcriptional regulator with PAS, ATPase and Fis domain